MAWWVAVSRCLHQARVHQQLLVAVSPCSISSLRQQGLLQRQTRQLTSSSALRDVRRNVEGRFAQPAVASAAQQSDAAAAAAGLGALGSMPTPQLPEVPLWRQRLAAFLRVFIPVSGASLLIYAWTHPDEQPLLPKKLPPHIQYIAAQQQESQEVLTNWSGTHEVRPKRFFQPETEEEVEGFVAAAHRAKQPLRVVGSGLSPNGLGFSEEGVMSMALMDKVLAVDKARMQVTVQPGVRIQQLVEALAPHGLTLQNFASIREQQVGGFIQVSAHGTGAGLPSVEEQVVGLRLVTPALGTLQLSAQQEPELFNLAKVGLGALGVVTQVTLQCVPRHRLVEHTFTTNLATVKKHHAQWLQEHRHLRYMWLPYTDTVVVVQCNPEDSPAGKAALATKLSQHDDATRLQPFRELLLSRLGPSAGEHVQELTHTQLRDELLALDPLNKDWVASVNHAEAEVWRRTEGVRQGWSDEILGFDCGGQQWVNEVAFPVGPASSLKGVTRDLQYMEQLLKEIKSHKIPAPVPIEQRWSSSSTADMSPVSGPPGTVHSWVGIIMYLPHDPQARQQVTDAFHSYVSTVQSRLGAKFNTATHWAKLEAPPAGSREAEAVRARLRARFPVDKFNAYRAELDPHNILANDWLNTLLPPPVSPASGSKQPHQ